MRGIKGWVLGAALGLGLGPSLFGAPAELSGWELRLGAGYGASLNNTYLGDANRPMPLSEGITGQAELLRRLDQDFSLGLGIFPVGLQRRYSYLDWSGGSYAPAEARESALYLPTLLSLYLERALGYQLSLMLGLGAGVVPATTVCVADSGSWNGGDNRLLDAGFAWRSQLGLRWSLNPRLGLIASLQQLSFDQHWFAPRALGGFWLADTKSFNQLGSSLALELRL